MEAADDLVLDALGDRQRRAILRLLAERPRPVHEIAAELPISRPAVSRHLRLLNCGDWREQPAARLGIRYVAVHRGLFAAFWPACTGRALAGLRAHGFRPLAADGDVLMFARSP